MEKKDNDAKRHGIAVLANHSKHHDVMLPFFVAAYLILFPGQKLRVMGHITQHGAAGGHISLHT